MINRKQKNLLVPLLLVSSPVSLSLPLFLPIDHQLETTVFLDLLVQFKRDSQLVQCTLPEQESERLNTSMRGL